MTVERRTKLVILHSNDMHGDFLAEAQGADGKLNSEIEGRLVYL